MSVVAAHERRYPEHLAEIDETWEQPGRLGGTLVGPRLHHDIYARLVSCAQAEEVQSQQHQADEASCSLSG